MNQNNVMKILFIIEDTYGDHDLMGVGILSSIAKNKNWKTSLIIRANTKTEIIIKRIKSYKPDVIAYSLATGEQNNILKIHREIKKHISCHFIFGGPHPTYFPEFINEDDIDTICIGEGEVAFSEYLERIEKDGNESNINNLYVKRDNKIIRNPLNYLVKDLDSIPFPDRKIFMEEIPTLYQYGILIAAQRGCPHSCTYCNNPLFKEMYENKGKILRTRSVDNVIDEIKNLGFTPMIIYFQDDNFLYKPMSWIEEFSKVYSREIKVPFAICTSADRIKEPIIKALKQAGLRSVVYALETGDEEVNKRLLKRSVKIDSVIEADSILKKYDIFTTLQSIILLPVQSPFKLDLKTLKINQRIKPTLAVSTPLTPYPGTEIAKYSIEHNYLDPVRINEIGKINKINTILTFKNVSSMKKSLLLHYFFDLFVHYPFLTPIYRLQFMIPIRAFKWFYFFYELIFAYKRYFKYMGIKFNYENIRYLLKRYIQYKRSN